MGLFGGIISGLGGILGSVIGGASNDKALKRASKAQQEGIRLGIEEQRRQFDLTRQDYAPWQEAGTAALGDMGDIMGLNGPEKQQAALGLLRGSPLFQTTYDAGEEALLQNASATGGLRGGNTQRGLADFGADTFTQVLMDQLGRLGSVSGTGAQMAGNLGGIRANMANQVSSGHTSIGNSQMNSIMNRQQNWNNMGSQIQSILASVMGGGMPRPAGGYGGL